MTGEWVGIGIAAGSFILAILGSLGGLAFKAGQQDQKIKANRDVIDTNKAEVKELRGEIDKCVDGLETKVDTVLDRLGDLQQRTARIEAKVNGTTQQR